MIDALGEVLPHAVGIAISPLPVIAVVLMLISERARATGPAFGVGFTAGVLVNTTIGYVAGGAIGSGSGGEPSTPALVFKVLMGFLFLALAVQQWRRRPRPGVEQPTPRLLAAIDTMSAPLALLFGLAISVLNVKNLPLGISAGLDIAGVTESTATGVATIVVFTLIATITVTAPVVAVIALGERASRSLTDVKNWLVTHDSAIMMVLFAVLGARSLGTGLAGLV